jgi:hypothetical protein
MNTHPSLVSYGDSCLRSMGISAVMQKLTVESGLRILSPDVALPAAPGNIDGCFMPNDSARHFCVQEIQRVYVLRLDAEAYCGSSGSWIRSAESVAPCWLEIWWSCYGHNLPSGNGFFSPGALLIALAVAQNQHVKALRTHGDSALGNVEAFKRQGKIVLSQRDGEYGPNHHLCVARPIEKLEIL